MRRIGGVVACKALLFGLRWEVCDCAKIGEKVKSIAFGGVIAFL